MTALLLLPPVFSLLVLGAHFLRAQQWLWVAACAVLIALLAVPRAWVARLAVVALLLGTLEWAWTAALLAQQRLALGQPWQRMVLILAVVAVLTAASTLVFRHRRLRERYRIGIGARPKS